MSQLPLSKINMIFFVQFNLPFRTITNMSSIYFEHLTSHPDDYVCRSCLFISLFCVYRYVSYCIVKISNNGTIPATEIKMIFNRRRKIKRSDADKDARERMNAPIGIGSMCATQPTNDLLDIFVWSCSRCSYVMPVVSMCLCCLMCFNDVITNCASPYICTKYE